MVATLRRHGEETTGCAVLLDRWLARSRLYTRRRDKSKKM
jgi:hypothetical protein